MKRLNILHFARTLRVNQTKAEKVLWQNIRKRQILGYRFNRQFVIEHSDILGDKNYFIVDFYCHEKKLIIEVDGKIHKSQKERDLQRENILKQMGFNILRIANEDIFRNIYSVKQEIENSLNSI